MTVNREQVIQSAERLVSRGKVEAAIKEYRKLLDENPSDAGTLNRVGDLWVRLNRIGEACKIFGQTAEHYTADGFFVKAIAIFKKVIKLDPTRLEVYERLAELYHKQGLINEARTQYQVLADYYLKHQNAASAIAIQQKMAQLEPQNPSHHVKLAEIYRQQKLLDKAVAEYRTIADLMLSKGHVEEATQVLLRGLDVNPQDLGFITDAVLGLRDAGQIGAAARLLAAAVERNPLAEKIAHLAGLPSGRPAPPRPPERDTRPGLEEEAAPAAASPPVPAAPPPAPEPAAPAGETPGLDREGGFVLDLDLEEAEAPPSPPPASPPASVAAAAATPEVEEPEFELDLGELEELAAPEPQPPAAPQVADAPMDIEVDIEWSFEPEPDIPSAPPAMRLDAELLERTAAEVQPLAVSREEDLVAEAEVFAKYGLKDKAHDRLREVLQMNPRHLGAQGLLVALHLEQGRHDRVAAIAEQMAVLAAETVHDEPWQHVRQRLLKAGYQFAEGRVIAPQSAAPARLDRVAELLDELMEEPEVAAPRAVRPEPEAAAPPPLSPPGPSAPPLPVEPPMAPPAAAPAQAAAPPPAPEAPAAVPEAKPARPPRKTRRAAELEAELDQLASRVLQPKRRAPARPAPPPAPPIEAPAPEPPPLVADEELPGITLPEEVPAAGIAPSAPLAAAPAEGTEWLDQAGAGGESQGAAEKLFDDEEQFFDLAAELERELGESDAVRGGGQPPEQSLEEIVEGFKKGVAENLSPEAYDTHFNLGIAYREMGLLDEAIGEFQLAAKDPGYLVDCCSMLGICFLDKGLPELAVKWYRRGLEAPQAGEEQVLGLLYDLGSVFVTTGDRNSAYKTYVELYGINSNYRDVVARLEELTPR